MKVNLYLLTLLSLLFGTYLQAQDCSTLSVTYATSESRCVATGSITLTVTGGSGNYNYKATGPITSPTTSTNTITGLPPGTYTITVKDLGTGCTKDITNIVVSGSYSDPRFQLTKTDAGCLGNDGTISVMNQQFGRSPFSFTIVSPSPSHVGATNTSGNFTGLTAGEYVIQLKDSCGGVQVRRITIENYSWWFDNASVTRFGCDSGSVSLVLHDNKGHTDPSWFSGFQYGYLRGPGDTVWSSTPNFNAWLGSYRNLQIVARDGCGNVQATTWFLANGLKPSLNSVSQSGFTCVNFNASITGSNLTSPNFCLFDNSNNQIACNTTGVFNNLSYGAYCIKVTDLCYDTVITRCFTGTKPTPSVAATVSISARTCSNFTASITGQQNLINPNFCLLDDGGLQLACNGTGVFTNVPYGDYCIRVTDACGTLINRCFTAARLVPTLTSYAITGANCTQFNVSVNGSNLLSPTYCLYDSVGNVITCNSSGIFTGLNHGRYCIKAVSCGDETNSLCFTGTPPVPGIGNTVSITNKACTTFDAQITGQINLTSPQYCLYDNTNTLVGCNGTGIFTSIPYGSYCIKMHDGCTDTTITRCFTQVPDVPSVSATLQQLSATCTTVSFKVNGTNLKSPNYCLYDSDNNLLECNASGTFNNYLFGSYCVKVTDGCTGTVFNVCQTFTEARGITLTTSKSCLIDTANVDVLFANGSAPYQLKVYHPNGSVVYSGSSSTNPTRLFLPRLPTGSVYKVVGTDNCGNKDSSTIAPDANEVTTETSVRSKCPSSVWANGAGDLTAAFTSNYYNVVPQVIKKDNTPFVRSYSSNSGSTYTFSDLEPATYVIEYTQQNCNARVYDTVTVAPYSFPHQGQSAIYQCDNNSFSLGADVQGGVSPFSFQIIGSLPDNPDISTAPQASAVFNINNGTTYSLVRLRSIDACGNGTLSDVSVLPLQNISIAATNLCFYNRVLLTVDTIPNASYQWYYKFNNASTDSTLVSSGLTYNLPFFEPEQAGIYICKVNVNSGCASKRTTFNLDGDCGEQLLPLKFNLNGRQSEGVNEVFWTNPDERDVTGYTLERKSGPETAFTAIAQLPVRKTGEAYHYEDRLPGPGYNSYRVRVHYANKFDWTNVVTLRVDEKSIQVYPNPVKDVVHITLGSSRQASYRLELIGSNGQIVLQKEMKNVQSNTLHFYRTQQVAAGVYLLRITESGTGIGQVFRLRYE